MNVTINEEICWCCEKEAASSVHHAIPQRLNPKNNVTMRLCRGCHGRLHSSKVDLSKAILNQLMIVKKKMDVVTAKQKRLSDGTHEEQS